MTPSANPTRRVATHVRVIGQPHNAVLHCYLGFIFVVITVLVSTNKQDMSTAAGQQSIPEGLTAVRYQLRHEDEHSLRRSGKFFEDFVGMFVLC